MKPINLGALSVDPVAIGSQGNAVLGIRDSGKTYTATLLAEGLFDAGIPFIAFDPIGVWRFMRVPGAGRGFPVVVAGGVDGDLPLTPAMVPALVEAAMQNGVSLVLDLFDINLSKADWRRIVMEALRTLLHKNQQYGLRHVFIEEAAEFAPQKVLDGHVYAEMEKLARMGGNARLGYTLINQRSEEVNKALLELCDNLFLHRQKGRNSLTALSKWLDIGNVTDHKAIISTLSTLPTGECWAWLEGSDTPVRTKVPAKRSLHPDRRVMRGDTAALQAKAVDVHAFVDVMRTTLGAVEAEAKANDPKVLKAQIVQLTNAVNQAMRAAGKPLPAPPPINASKEQIEAAHQAGERSGIKIGLARAREAIGALKVDDFARAPAETSPPTPSAPRERAAPERASPTPEARASFEQSAEGPIPGPHQRIIDAIAWWNAFGVPRPKAHQVAYIAGYAMSGTWDTYRSRLRGQGLIELAAGRISLTEAGVSVARAPSAAPTVDALHNAVRGKLPGPLIKFFDVLLRHYPDTVSRTDWAAEAGYEPNSGTADTYRSRVLGLELAEAPVRGQVRAADWLFP